MKKLPLILLLAAIQTCSRAQCYESLRFMKRIFNPDQDNKIYKRDRNFQFDYQYTKNGTSYRVFLDDEINDRFNLVVDTTKN